MSSINVSAEPLNIVELNPFLVCTLVPLFFSFFLFSSFFLFFLHFFLVKFKILSGTIFLWSLL